MAAARSLAEMLSLRGHRALITGASYGIGEAMARRFAEAGADLILVARSRERLARLARDLEARYRVRVQYAALDLADKTAIDAFWTTGGPLPDILVNNAGIYPFRDFLRVDEGFLRRILTVNLEAALWMSQHFIRRRGRQGGVILNVGTIEAFLPFAAHLVHYAVAKAGLLALTRGLARDYGRWGYRINALVPGGVLTPGVLHAMKRILHGEFHLIASGLRFFGRLPMGRFGSPDEIARMAVVLCSDLASYVHGAVIPVDGGFLSA